MEAFSVLAAGILASAGIRAIRNRWKRRWLPGLEWTGSEIVPLMPRKAQDLMVQLLCGYDKATLESANDTSLCFKRGDWSARSVERVRPWLELPMAIGMGFTPTPGGTRFYVFFKTPDGVPFDEIVAELFRDCAGIEFAAFVGLMRNQGERAEVTSSPQSGGTLDAAYAALHLKPGAAWRDVQAAYREACKQYHPDKLSDQKPHLVELAVREFKRMTAAYQTLKQHLAA